MKGIVIGVIAALVLVAAPARAGKLDTTSDAYQEMPKAARKYVAKVVKAIESGKAKAFLALLPKEIEVHGEYDAFTLSFTKAQLKKAIKRAGALDDALWLSQGDWTVAVIADGYELYRGPDGPKSATLRITKVKKAWRVTSAALVDRVDYNALIDGDEYKAHEVQPGEATATGGIFRYTIVREGSGQPTDGTLIEPAEPSPDDLTTRLGPLTTTNIDRAVGRRYLKRNLPKLKYCFEKQLLATPGLEGEVKFRVQLNGSGTVSNATAVGIHPTVAKCIAFVLGGTEFPKSADTNPMAFSGTLSFYRWD